MNDFLSQDEKLVIGVFVLAVGLFSVAVGCLLNNEVTVHREGSVIPPKLREKCVYYLSDDPDEICFSPVTFARYGIHLEPGESIKCRMLLVPINESQNDKEKESKDHEQ